MRRLSTALLALFITACDDGSGARQALAQCKLAPAAIKLRLVCQYDPGYMLLCMQSKGYAEDNRPTEAGGMTCQADWCSHENVACYRRDNALAKWLADAKSK